MSAAGQQTDAMAKLVEQLDPLVLRLVPDVSVSRQRFRGAASWVLGDHLNSGSWRIAERLGPLVTMSRDHGVSVADCRRACGLAPGDSGGTEFLTTLARLHAAGLLQASGPGPALAALERIAAAWRSNGTGARAFNPLAIRLPLFDPTPLLARADPLGRWLFSRAGAAVAGVMILAGALAAAVNAAALMAAPLDRVLAAGSLLGFALAYLLLKSLHEFAHALAVRRWGGEVHELGVMLLVFFPVPYCDASASTLFPERHARMIVAAAGIIVELVVAALALLLWLLVEPGTVRTLAWQVAAVGGVSTLLFNGNPLLRFDGYYVLSDWLQIPNLFQRSRTWLVDRVQGLLFGLPPRGNPPGSRMEALHLAWFGISSMLYRVLVMAGIVWLLAGRFFIVGVALALWLLLAQVLRPAVTGLLRLDAAARQHECSRAVRLRLALLLLLGVGVLGLLPLPRASVVPAVLAVEEDAAVRAPVAGFITAVLVRPGAQVASGQPLLRLDDPALDRDIAVLRARVSALEAGRVSAGTRDPVAVGLHDEALRAARGELQERIGQRDALQLRAATAGRFWPAAAADLQGRHVGRGEALAYVVAPGRIVARAVLDEPALQRISDGIRSIRVLPLQAPAGALPVSLDRVLPAALVSLPHPALGTAGGGVIPVDPESEEGLEPLQSVFRADLRFARPPAFSLVGSRALARIEHPPETLLARGYSAVSRLFLAQAAR